jgi:drug/metabolite transporter (DMT)-like permease
MSGLAIALVLGAAVTHATWNFFLKKSGGGPGILTASSLLSLALYLPAAVFSVYSAAYTFSVSHLGLMFGSGLIQACYLLLLDREYARGELSVVYPIARGTAPLLTMMTAALFLGERPGAIAVAGAALIGGSAFVLTGSAARTTASRLGAVGYAVLAGAVITLYTVWDKLGVAGARVPPLAYDWGSSAFRSMLLLGITRGADLGGVATAWRTQRKTVVAIAVLSPLAYVLVLTAMVFTPVSRVAPAREISIVVAVLLGALFLGEAKTRRRLMASMAMAAGVVAIALG